MMHFIRELNMQYADENQDCESPCGFSTLANMPDYKSFKFIDNTKVMKGLKESKRIYVPEVRMCKEVEVLKVAGGIKSSTACEDAVSGTEYPTSPVEAEGSHGRRKIYIKKNVVDSFMPEMVGFFEDSNYHFFKEIFRDIEARYEEHRSMQNYEMDRSSTCSILASDVVSEPVISSETGCNLFKSENQLDAMTQAELREESEAADDSLENIRQEDQVVIKFRNAKAVSSSHYPETEQADYGCNTSEASDESGEGESTSTVTNTEASNEDSDHQDNIDAGSVSLPTSSTELEHETSVLKTSRNQNFADQQGHEEPNSLFDDHDLSPIEILDPLPYSGRLSFGSRTSSSSSFSFPILPSEWSGTPVRMPSTDKRHLQKHQYWRKNLLCCKF